MRLRSVLAVGVTAAALSPAVVALPATADDDPLLRTKNCLTLAILGTAQDCPGSGTSATTDATDAGDSSDATDTSDTGDAADTSDSSTDADGATDVGSGDDVGAIGVPDETGDSTDTSGTDTVGDADTTDGTDTTGATDTADGTDTSDTSDGTDATDTSDGTDSTDSGTSVIPAVDTGDTGDAGDVPIASDENTDTGADAGTDTGTGTDTGADTGTDTGNTPVVTSVEQQPAVQPQPKEGLADTAAGLQSTCAVEDSDAFPIESAINPGPKTYYPGGGFENWSVKLTNTSDDTCHNIHPIVVFLDRDRDLQSSQAQFEFRTPDGKWHPVPFERTDVDEHVGVFDDGFGGFSIPAGESVTVPVRLRFTADTTANRVTASLAVVQRRDDDGEWVGESEDYVFDISGNSQGSSLPGDAPAADELAKTGRSSDDSLLGLGATAGAFLLGGGALVVGSRRRFRRR